VKTNPGGTLFNRKRQCALYADDMAVLGRAVKYIAEALEDMTTVASQMGLTIKVSKAKCMFNRKRRELNQKKLKEMEKNMKMQKCLNIQDP
jgi:hypothetical protein